MSRYETPERRYSLPRPAGTEAGGGGTQAMGSAASYHSIRNLGAHQPSVTGTLTTDTNNIQTDTYIQTCRFVLQN